MSGSAAKIDRHGRGPAVRNAQRLSIHELRRRTEVRFEYDLRARRVVEQNPGGMTVEAIAAYFGVTKQRIHQLERKALKKLRKNKLAQVLPGFLGELPTQLEHTAGARMRRRERVDVVQRERYSMGAMGLAWRLKRGVRHGR